MLVGMNARRVVPTACLLSLAGLVGTSADASPAPAPAVSVVTYVATGTALPATTVSAAWSQVKPGCGGTLAASGAVLSGTSTVVQGVFTSRAFRPRGGLIGLVGLSEDGRTIMKPFPQGMSVAFRMRNIGHAWSRWWSFSFTTDPDFPPSLLTYSTEGGSIALFELAPRGRPPLQQVQIRLGDQITKTGLADDRFDVAIGC
jgi:hypothetical protein